VATQVVDGAAHEVGAGPVALELLGCVLVGAPDQHLATPCLLARKIGGEGREPFGRQAPAVPAVGLVGGDAADPFGVPADPRRDPELPETAAAVDELPGPVLGGREADAVGQILVAVVPISGAQPGDEPAAVDHAMEAVQGVHEHGVGQEGHTGDEGAEDDR